MDLMRMHVIFVKQSGVKIHSIYFQNDCEPKIILLRFQNFNFLLESFNVLPRSK
jgi:hypothetical protein